MVVQFRSFEETLAVIGALVVAGLLYWFFNATALTSIMAGGLSAMAIAYVTFFEFTLNDQTITYRNRFREDVIPLAWVKKVGVATFWRGLPGKTYVFILRHPPAPWAGYFRRTGLITWPSAEKWVAAVNAAVQGSADSR